ncbi:MAG: N-acetyltransferase [Methanobacteriota archaeon]|nr:MAG: N-acetyltransferase [Euryarchaeota archaeon]
MENLVGKKVILRPPETNDIPFFVRLLNDEENRFQLMLQPGCWDRRKVEKWLGKRIDGRDCEFFVALDASTEAPFGFVQLDGISRVSRFGYFGVCIDKPMRRKGYFKEIYFLFERHLLSLGIRKILLEVLKENELAIKLYEKIGFVHVGVLREHIIARGSYWDVLVMEKLVG